MGATASTHELVMVSNSQHEPESGTRTNTPAARRLHMARARGLASRECARLFDGRGVVDSFRQRTVAAREPAQRNPELYRAVPGAAAQSLRHALRPVDL